VRKSNWNNLSKMFMSYIIESIKVDGNIEEESNEDASLTT
jgi:hypothetical protein